MVDLLQIGNFIFLNQISTCQLSGSIKKNHPCKKMPTAGIDLVIFGYRYSALTVSAITTQILK